MVSRIAIQKVCHRCFRVKFPVIALLLTLSPLSYGQLSGISCENPSTLGRGNNEISLGFGLEGISCWGEKSFRVKAGIQVGRGVTRNFDIKFSFFRDSRENIADGFNILQFLPKIGDKAGRFSVFIPLGACHTSIRDSEMELERNLILFISPRIVFTVIKKEQFDICLGNYGEIDIAMGSKAVKSYGITAGTGICNKTGTLAIRAELGINVIPFSDFPAGFNVGLKLVYNIKPDIPVKYKLGYHYNRLFEIYPGLFCHL